LSRTAGSFCAHFYSHRCLRATRSQRPVCQSTGWYREGIHGSFDPYEEPKDAEVTINTAELTQEKRPQEIILHLERRRLCRVNGEQVTEMDFALKVMIGFVVGTLIGMTRRGGGVLLAAVLIFGLRVPAILAVARMHYLISSQNRFWLMHFNNGNCASANCACSSDGQPFPVYSRREFAGTYT